MTTDDRREAGREPLEVERLVETEELSIDPLLMDRIPTRRSKTDADRLLRLLDELEGGSDE